MKKCTIVSCLILAVVAIVIPASALVGPQDHWYSVTNWAGYSNPMGMALGTNGYIFVAERGANQIRVIDVDGTTITNWTGFNLPMDVAVSTNGLVYVSDTGNNMIKVFDHSGNAITSWGSAGTNDTEFNTPTSVSILRSGNIVVADGNNRRIQIFDPMGGFIRKWGEAGVFEGQFIGTVYAEVGSDGMIYVGEGSGYINATSRIQIFNEDGAYLRNYISIQRSGAGFISRGLKDFFFYNAYYSRFCAYSNVSGSEALQEMWQHAGGCVIEMPDGTLVISRGNALYVYKRYYRQKSYNPDADDDVPVPVLIKAEQRANTVWMDIDYIVHDGNDANLTVAVLAFVNGGTDLGSAVKMSTFVENSATNLGQNISTGTEHHLTWDVAADWSVDYSDVRIEVLARDSRELMDFHYITIPSNGPNAELTINKSPLHQNDLLNVWMWLIAIDDPAIGLVSGAVIGQSGIYTGITLASGTSTTVDGRAFLFERFNVAEVTVAEKQQAIDARAIVGNESTYWVKRLP